MDAGAHDIEGSSSSPPRRTPSAVGVVPLPPRPALPLAALGDLQRQVLEAVAARWFPAAGGPRGPGPGPGPGLAEGLAVLLAALPPGVGAGTDDRGPTTGRRRRTRRGLLRSCTEDVRPGDGPAAQRATLRRIVVVTGRLAEAGHRAAMTMSAVGREDEAEVADEVSTCAHALRMLAEIELSTIPGP